MLRIDSTSLAIALVGLLYGGIFGPALAWPFVRNRNGFTLEEMRAAVESRRKTRVVRSSRKEGFEGDDDLAAILILAVAVVAAYVKWRAWVLLGISLISVAAGFAASGVAFVAWWKSVIVGARAVAACMLTPLLLCGAGFIMVALLWAAPAAPEGTREALAACSVERIGLQGIAYILYSIAGAVFYGLASVSSIIWSVAAVSTIYASKGVAPRAVWRYVAGRLSLPLGWGWPLLLLVTTGVGILFASGLMYSWATSFAEWNVADKIVELTAS